MVVTSDDDRSDATVRTNGARGGDELIERVEGQRIEFSGAMEGHTGESGGDGELDQFGGGVHSFTLGQWLACGAILRESGWWGVSGEVSVEGSRGG